MGPFTLARLHGMRMRWHACGMRHHSSQAGGGSDKPPLSQKVRFIDRVRVEARGGTGGGGSAALFGRTGAAAAAARVGSTAWRPLASTT